MFNLTQQERAVVLFLAAVILVGSLLEILNKKSATVRQFFEFTQNHYSSSSPKTPVQKKVTK